MRPGAALTLIDLFSGCGGVTAGFKAEGFRALAAVDRDPVAACTYHLNHPEVALRVEDIRSVSPESMMKQCGLQSGQLTVLSVCAPCQPFSRQNRRRSGDDRALLVLEAVRFANALRPAFLFMENVPGLGQDSDTLNGLLGGLEALGYRISPPAVVDAVSYGVPQFRRRLVLLGTRLNIDLQMPDATHQPPGLAARTGGQAWVTVGEALAGLESLHAGEQSATDPLHRARRHSALSLERLRHIPPDGGSRDSLPDHLRPACHRRSPHTGYHDVYGRLDSRRPAGTLTTGCTNFTRGRFAHPVRDRAITPREAARLQTFPDSYQFCGNYDQISAQIGNAVPVRLAAAVARHLRAALERADGMP